MEADYEMLSKTHFLSFLGQVCCCDRCLVPSFNTFLLDDSSAQLGMEEVSEFFRAYAVEQHFDPFDAEAWREVNIQKLMQRKVGCFSASDSVANPPSLGWLEDRSSVSRPQAGTQSLSAGQCFSIT